MHAGASSNAYNLMQKEQCDIMPRAPSKDGKQILAAVYCDNLMGRGSTVQSLSNSVIASKEYLNKTCKELQEQYLKKAKDGYHLTSKGRKSIMVVFAGGAFDIIHPGHVHTLTESKKLGDVLVVSIARNSTVLKNKGREPINDEKLRRDLVQALRCVDCAILGSETDIFETVIKVRPNIIALGYDQRHNERALIDEARKRGLDVDVVRLSSPIPNIKSSKIVRQPGIMTDF